MLPKIESMVSAFTSCDVGILLRNPSKDHAWAQGIECVTATIVSVSGDNLIKVAGQSKVKKYDTCSNLSGDEKSCCILSSVLYILMNELPIKSWYLIAGKKHDQIMFLN